jgi:hypothetical protein
VPILPRGAGSSQCGQTVGEALVIDHTKYLARVLEVDAQAARRWCSRGGPRRAERDLRSTGLWFPVDVSTSAQATHRRHGGQQLVRLALDRLRKHGAQRARDRGRHRGRQRWRFGPMNDGAAASTANSSVG